MIIGDALVVDNNVSSLVVTQSALCGVAVGKKNWSPTKCAPTGLNR
jgi:hypothetical protein